MMPTMPVKVDVLRMGTGGEAVAHVPGSNLVQFVPYGAPGDKLLVEPVESHARFQRAQLLEVLKPGAGRIEAKCGIHFKPGAKRWCGGCDWQHLSTEAQLAAKRANVQECLERIGRLKFEVPPVLASPEAWRYRNKVQVPFQSADGGLKAGFYQPGTHDVVPFEDCIVQPELSVRLVHFVREMAERRKWPALDEKTHRGWLRHLFVRTSLDNKAVIAFVTKTDDFRDPESAVAELKDAFPELVGIHQNIQPAKTNVIFGPKWHKLWGKGRIREQVGKITLAASPAAFLQVNTRASEVLYNKAREFLSDDGFRPVLLMDLYSGIGSIALYLADLAEYVTGVEINRRAVEDAELNASLNKIENARFLHGKAEYVLPKLKIEKEGEWAGVLDPPRQGCEPAVLNYLKRPEFKRVVYIACDPASFARDAALLEKEGWKLSKLQPVDLFPQTSHIEICARFDR
jgi:23S rRNA (uracil1939-C5)-methyltransferase